MFSTWQRHLEMPKFHIYEKRPSIEERDCAFECTTVAKNYAIAGLLLGVARIGLDHWKTPAKASFLFTHAAGAGMVAGLFAATVCSVNKIRNVESDGIAGGIAGLVAGGVGGLFCTRNLTKMEATEP